MKWFKQAKHHLDVETGWGYWYHLWHSIKNSWTLIVIAFKILGFMIDFILYLIIVFIIIIPKVK